MSEGRSCGSFLATEGAREPEEEQDRDDVEWREREERCLERVRRAMRLEPVARRADKGGPEPEPDEVHHEEEQRTRHHTLVGAYLFLHQRDGRGEVEVVQHEHAGEEDQRELPRRRAEKRDVERERDRE